MEQIQAQFGNIDIYLFDQILKGRYQPGQKVLDVGCGSGRNSYFFLQNDFEVYGVDQSPEAIASIQALAASGQNDYPLDRFQVSSIEGMNFKKDSFDLVICNAVLHFAKNDEHFDQMLRSIWQVLKPGGYFFCRLASTIGVEQQIKPLGDRRYELPSGTIWYLVDEALLLRYTRELQGELIEYIKTTNVQNLRAMTTWCLRK